MTKKKITASERYWEKRRELEDKARLKLEKKTLSDDKDGNPKPRIEDKHNNTIDETIYAFSEDMDKNNVRFIQY